MRVDLRWSGDQRFEGDTGRTKLLLDGRGEAGPSPVETLALALASCMGIDLVHILTKGRAEPGAVEVRLEADRSPQDPRRLTSVKLHFTIRGDIPVDKVERALALSREKYCSVWHSLRQDIPFDTSFEVV
jgi:putative redox protein